MFDNPLLENEFLGGQRGNLARLGTETASIWDIAQRHMDAGTGLVIVAGRNYGAGSLRDWAAKGLRLLGVVAVLAESFERIHRSNLIGMGVLPLTFAKGTTRHDLALSGDESLAIRIPDTGLTPGGLLEVEVGGRVFPLHLDAHSTAEVGLLREGGLLPLIRKRFVTRGMPEPCEDYSKAKGTKFKGNGAARED